MYVYVCMYVCMYVGTFLVDQADNGRLEPHAGAETAMEVLVQGDGGGHRCR